MADRDNVCTLHNSVTFGYFASVALETVYVMNVRFRSPFTKAVGLSQMVA